MGEWEVTTEGKEFLLGVIKNVLDGDDCTAL
jgi:hypothetical protein